MGTSSYLYPRLQCLCFSAHVGKLEPNNGYYKSRQQTIHYVYLIYGHFLASEELTMLRQQLSKSSTVHRVTRINSCI